MLALIFISPGIWAKAPRAPKKLKFKRLQLGVEYAAPLIAGATLPVAVADRRLHIVRVDPTKAKLRALIAGRLDGKQRTAGQWARRHKLAVAINLGMYRHDHLTHVGFLRAGRHENNRRWTSTYQSVLVFGPLVGKIKAQILDRDRPGFSKHRHYETVVQNLRLIRAPGVSVWKKNRKRWSEAALAIDNRHRLLFIFCRAPYSMKVFSRLLLDLPLSIVRAMHMEGGPEASLSIRAKGLTIDLAGSYETGFNENDSNRRQWALPLVLGVERANTN